MSRTYRNWCRPPTGTASRNYRQGAEHDLSSINRDRTQRCSLTKPIGTRVPQVNDRLSDRSDRHEQARTPRAHDVGSSSSYSRVLRPWLCKVSLRSFHPIWSTS